MRSTREHKCFEEYLGKIMTGGGSSEHLWKLIVPEQLVAIFENLWKTGKERT